MMDVLNYKCPNCSGPLKFDIDNQSWKCEFCASEYNAHQLQEFEMQGDSGNRSDSTYDDAAISYHCPSCGGTIVTEKHTAATFCVFCHNPAIIAAEIANERKPEHLIPFKLKKEQAVLAVQELCRRYPLLPKDFREYAQKGEVSGLYVPFWLFDIDISAGITATGTQVTSWIDGRFKHTKTDTYRIERAAELNFSNIPADGSSKMDDRLMDALEPFDYSQMIDFKMEYLSGHYAENYDVDADAVFGRINKRIDTGVKKMMDSWVAGYNSVQRMNEYILPQKPVHQNVMLPVWTLMSEYRGEYYTFAMNGQTGKMVGKLPLSKTRLTVWFAAIGSAITLICFIGGMIL